VKQSSNNRGKVFLLLVLCAACAGYVYADRAGMLPWKQPTNTAKAAAPLPVPVTFGKVESGAFDTVATGLGTVQAYNTVQVKSRVDGEIQKVAFSEGQRVRKGDVLVEIDPRPYQAALDQAKAKKVQDEANLKNARLDLDRYTKLGDYASRQQTDTQGAKVAQLVAQVASDQAAIDNAQTQLNYATVRSPLDGITGFRQVDIGNIVNGTSQTPIVQITQVEPIFAIFTAPEEQLRTVTAAMARGDVPVEAWSTDGKTKLSTGKVALINNQVDTATGTVRIKAVFENKDHALWPGLSVSTRMRLGRQQDALTVPDDAIQHGPDGLFVFVVGDGSKARQQPVTAGRSNEGRTQIFKGLESGQTVITAGQYKVQNGSHVADRHADDQASVGGAEGGR
jgi:multidrug efflux system membrane fusion protein